MEESGEKYMFGNYTRSLDDKNRVMIPSKLRDPLGDILYITLGTDNVLEIRDDKHFSVWRDKLLSANTLNKNARVYARLLLGNTIEVKPDKQGRVALTEDFITKTGITKEITFVGVGNKIEIWPAEAFVEFQNNYKNEGSLDDLAKKLLKDGVEL